MKIGFFGCSFTEGGGFNSPIYVDYAIKNNIIDISDALLDRVNLCTSGNNGKTPCAIASRKRRLKPPCPANWSTRRDIDLNSLKRYSSWFLYIWFLVGALCDFLSGNKIISFKGNLSNVINSSGYPNVT